MCQKCFDAYWNSNPGTHKVCPQCSGALEPNRLIFIDNFLNHHIFEPIAPLDEEQATRIATIQQLVSSTKIDKMIEILEETDIETGAQDKITVLSQFTAFLDLVERSMTEKSIHFLRYGGTVNLKARAEAITRFFRDPNITVLLMSTKCTSLGLNLTCANRVILLDI